MAGRGKKSLPQLLTLKDEAINSAKKDDFDHASIAKTLDTLIKSSPVPSTIGLLANWGSGKSGVARILRKHVRSDKKIAFIEFDVWKYEDEASIRRQFMHTVHNQLKKQHLLGKAKLNERLDGSTTEDVFEGVDIDQAGLAKLIILGSALIIGVTVSVVLNAPWVSAITVLGTIVGIVGFEQIIKTGLGVFRNRKHTITKSRITDADEFEEEFRDLIDTSLAEKIVVVVDNLDRATDDKAIAILSTIKSFLEYGKCIYIIPCDESAIKKHLKNTFGGKDGDNYDADEFLRKFFNTYLRIPPFISADLQDYTEKLLKQTNFHHYYPDIQNLATIITAAYRDNPRQIKQFINVFISHFTLATERESQGLLPKGDVTTNPEFLAKILIINQKWSEAYEALFTGKSVDEASDELSYVEFLQASSLAEEPDNIKSFLYFKQSTRASNLPPGTADPLQTALEDAKLDDAKSFIAQIQSSQDYTPALNQFVLQLIEDASQKSRAQVLVNIINSLTMIWESNIFSIQDDVKRRVTKALADRVNIPGNYAIDINFVHECLKYAGNAFTRNKVTSLYISGIDEANVSLSNASDNVIKTIDFLNLELDTFRRLGAMKKRFNGYIQAYFQDQQVIEHLLKNPDITSLFEAETISKLASSITKDNLNDLDPNLYTLKSQLLISLPQIPENAVQSYVDMARFSTSDALNGQVNVRQVSIILELLLAFLDRWGGSLNKNNLIETLVDEFLQKFRSGPQVDVQFLLIKVLIKLRVILDGAQLTEVNSAVAQFIKSSNAEWVNRLIQEQQTSNPDFIKDFASPLYDMALNNDDYANIVWSIGDDRQKIILIEGMLNSGASRGLHAVDIVADSINDKAALAELLLRFAAAASYQDKMAFYDKLALLKLGNSPENKKMAADQIIQLAKGSDETIRTLARDVLNILRPYLSKKLREAMCEELIEWMEPQGKLNYTFAPTINFCFENFDAMSKSYIDRLYLLIFKQWILQETDPQQILRGKELALDNISQDDLSNHIEELRQKKEREPHLGEAIEDLIGYIGSNLRK